MKSQNFAVVLPNYFMPIVCTVDNCIVYFINLLLKVTRRRNFWKLYNILLLTYKYCEHLNFLPVCDCYLEKMGKTIVIFLASVIFVSHCYVLKGKGNNRVYTLYSWDY